MCALLLLPIQPSEQFAKAKEKVMGVHIVNLPNRIYGGILASSAAMHITKAFATTPKINFYELKRAKEVIETMIWQLKNREYIALNIGDFLGIMKGLEDQLGSFNFGNLPKISKWGPGNFLLKQIDEIEKKLKEMEGTLNAKLWGELGEKLKNFSKASLDPLAKEGLVWKLPCLLPKDCPSMIPENPFVKVLERVIEKQIGKKFLVTGPKPEILDEEKIPAKYPSIDSDFEPVFLHNGEFYQSVTDVTIVAPGPGQGLPFQFTRIYRSMGDFLGILGHQWTHNFAQSLKYWDSPQGEGLTYINEEGKKYFFKSLGEGFFESPADFDWRLEENSQGYLLQNLHGDSRHFDKNGRFLSMEDAEGNSLRCLYDEQNRLQAVEDTLGRKIIFHYSSGGLLESIEDSTGRRWRYNYDEAGELIAAVSPGTPSFPQGKTTRYRYQNHKMILIMDPKGQIFLQNFYDRLGRVAKQIYGEEKYSIEARYDGFDTWVKDRRDVFHLYEQDPFGNLVAHSILKKSDELKRLPLTPIDQAPPNWKNFDNIEYDLWGNVVAIGDELGKKRRFEVDASNLIAKEISASSEERKYFYDANDNIVRTEIPARKLVLEYGYDLLDRMVFKTEIMNNSNKLTTRFEYDPQGRLTRYIFPLGNDIRFSYDEEGNPVGKNFDENFSPQPQEDASAYLDSDAEYDSIGRPVRIKKTKLAWDDNSRLQSITDEKGESTFYVYDESNRLVSEKYPNGSQIRYAYDDGDRLIGMVDRRNIFHRFFYDERGRLTRHQAQDSAQTFQYDEQDWLIVAMEGKTRIDFAYDKDDHLIGEAIDGRWVAKNLDADGEVSAIRYPSGLQIVHERDENKNLKRIYAASQRIANFEDPKEDIPVKSELVIEEPAKISFERDVAGNLIRDEDFLYTYDAFNRLAQVLDHQNKIVAKYFYDPFGRIVRVDYPLQQKNIEYSYDGWHRVEAYESDGTKRSYIYGDGLDEILAQKISKKESNDFYFYHRDRLGSVRRLTDLQGRAVESYDYEPFGYSASTSNIGNDLKFLGRPVDPVTQLVDLRHRFYSPKLRTFISADPLGYKNHFFNPSNVFLPTNISYHAGQGGASRTTFPNFVARGGEISILDADLFYADENFLRSIPETDLFLYAHGDPLNYFDPLGLYAISISLPHWGSLPKNNFRNRAGMLLLRNDAHQIVAGPFKVLGRSSNTWYHNGHFGKNKNKSRNPLYKNGDTPTGKYSVLGVEEGIDQNQFGPHVIRMNPLEGDALRAYQNGRRGLLIHGGRKSANGKLVSTLGCIRMHDSDLKKLVNSLNRLKKKGDAHGMIEIDEKEPSRYSPQNERKISIGDRF